MKEDGAISNTRTSTQKLKSKRVKLNGLVGKGKNPGTRMMMIMLEKELTD